MRLITWNINSVRRRLHEIKRITQLWAPDILCLQETKVINSLFPSAPLREMGYTYQDICGTKQYNGVATLSKTPLEKGFCFDIQKKQEARYLNNQFHTAPDTPIDLHNIYLPAGGDIPNADQNPKFAYKLAFLDNLTEYFAGNNIKNKKAIIVGDLNVAPTPYDVWNHKHMIKRVSHSPIECEKFNLMKESGEFLDALRHFTQNNTKLFSWWSYRSRDFRVSNRGLRLDFILTTPPLTPFLKDARILEDVRAWDNPSDHAPVLIDLHCP